MARHELELALDARHPDGVGEQGGHVGEAVHALCSEDLGAAQRCLGLADAAARAGSAPVAQDEAGEVVGAGRAADLGQGLDGPLAVGADDLVRAVGGEQRAGHRCRRATPVVRDARVGATPTRRAGGGDTTAGP
ncbi:hypothetical protein, partial [Actinosynnema sp.]|uniref:hypothetical protein n=1 Tax=Actinosynnema sp. TaxID=1872144 RepID=UPI003F85CEDC